MFSQINFQSRHFLIFRIIYWILQYNHKLKFTLFMINIELLNINDKKIALTSNNMKPHKTPLPFVESLQ